MFVQSKVEENDLHNTILLMWNMSCKGLHSQKYIKCFSNGTCVFHHPKYANIKCALGWCDPGEVLINSCLLLNGHCNIPWVQKSLKNVSTESHNRLRKFELELQKAHDYASSPFDMEERLTAIAVDWNLPYPPPLDVPIE